MKTYSVQCETDGAEGECHLGPERTERAALMAYNNEEKKRGTWPRLEFTDEMGDYYLVEIGEQGTVRYPLKPEPDKRGGKAP